MANKATREQIIAAADELFYRRGYEYTSFADIAAAVNISRGNFYYHFRSKDDILDAVIQRRLAGTQTMLEQWEAAADSPQGRIRSFIQMLVLNGAEIAQYGCPVGTLCSELAKLDHCTQAEAGRLFMLFRDWLARQFEQLGHGAESDRLAMHLLARSQGIATLSSAFRDPDFIRQEVELLDAWLQPYIR